MEAVILLILQFNYLWLEVNRDQDVFLKVIPLIGYSCLWLWICLIHLNYAFFTICLQIMKLFIKQLFFQRAGNNQEQSLPPTAKAQSANNKGTWRTPICKLTAKFLYLEISWVFRRKEAHQISLQDWQQEKGPTSLALSQPFHKRPCLWNSGIVTKALGCFWNWWRNLLSPLPPPPPHYSTILNFP